MTFICWIVWSCVNACIQICLICIIGYTWIGITNNSTIWFVLSSIQNWCYLLIQRNRYGNIVLSLWRRIRNILYQLCFNFKSSHWAVYTLVLMSGLEIYKNVICRRDKECCSIKSWINHCKIIWLVLTYIILKLSMKLYDNIDISIKPVRLNFEHNPTIICLLNKCLISTYNLFAVPLVSGVWNCS